ACQFTPQCEHLSVSPLPRAGGGKGHGFSFAAAGGGLRAVRENPREHRVPIPRTEEAPLLALDATGSAPSSAAIPLSSRIEVGPNTGTEQALWGSASESVPGVRFLRLRFVRVRTLGVRSIRLGLAGLRGGIPGPFRLRLWGRRLRLTGPSGRGFRLLRLAGLGVHRLLPGGRRHAVAP